MDLDAQRFLVRQFYEEYHVNLYETICFGRCEGFTPICERIASVKVSTMPYEVEIERINQNIPQIVCDAFARHLWYSQYNFAHLFLVKVPIDRQNFFFLFHAGVSDDAWDNDTSFVEIFAQQGDFVGATHFSYDETVKWIEKQFTHEDCRDGKRGEPSPPWSEDDTDAVYYNEPLWTEDMLIQAGAEIEEEGTIIRYRL